MSVEGVRGERFMLPAEIGLLEAPEPAGRPGVAFLAPLDPFVWDRDFLRALYDFDYVWEVYVPAARRRWGYYVLPILFGDRLVGRLEPRFDRRAGTLRVLDLWWEDGFDPLAAAGFVEALTDALDGPRAVRRGRPDRPAPSGSPSAARVGHPRPTRDAGPDQGMMWMVCQAPQLPALSRALIRT